MRLQTSGAKEFAVANAPLSVGWGQGRRYPEKVFGNRSVGLIAVNSIVVCSKRTVDDSLLRDDVRERSDPGGTLSGFDFERGDGGKGMITLLAVGRTGIRC